MKHAKLARDRAQSTFPLMPYYRNKGPQIKGSLMKVKESFKILQTSLPVRQISHRLAPLVQREKHLLREVYAALQSPEAALPVTFLRRSS